MKPYYPDKWCLLEIQGEEEVVYKILGSWWGGLQNRNSWRTSSGVEKVEEKKESRQFLVHGFSGSIYACNFDHYGYHMYAYAIVKDKESIRVIKDEKEAFKILRNV